MYNGEPILPARLEILNETVYRFYITESSVTFSGNKKTNFFKDLHSEIFKPYTDKITWNIFEPSEDTTGNSWAREELNRNNITEIIRKDIKNHLLPPPENIVILNTDADEVPSVTALEQIKPGNRLHSKIMNHPMKLDMNMSYFNFNWNNGPGWRKGNVVLAKHILEGNYTMNGLRNQESGKLPSIPNAGNHLSWGFDIENIVRKFESFSHQELNKRDNKSHQHIMTSLEGKTKLWSSMAPYPQKHFDYKELSLPLQKFHLELCKSQGVSPSTGQILTLFNDTTFGGEK
ncbi:hypothetical protein CTEN210_05062 [Chaetoceros tenuissimus]|uniref:Beta-1,4-mannosyl-glycoprotein beta-1,4-N-acetylglucosaminyltransferase n=1 Tax=Chaetoceros tenuissimus TaxID=426638 RepID=A0AAD3H359_9STRA|nr:hypothetical protein CTEN210_05062 [Chaetoceros tenuissimus]